MPRPNQPSPRWIVCICLCLSLLATGCGSGKEGDKSSAAPSPLTKSDSSPKKTPTITEKTASPAPSQKNETLHEGKTFAQWIDLLGDRADGPVASEVLMQAGADAVPVLLATLKSGDGDRRKRVMAILRDGQAKKDPRVIEAFIAAVDDEQPTIRYLAIGALRDAGVKQPQAITALAQTLKINREPWREQLLVLLYLKDLGPDAAAATDAVAEVLLFDARRFARRKALDVLIAIGGTEPEALGALVKAMSDQDDKVREASWERLKAMGPKASGASPALAQRLIGDDELLSQMAGAVLVKIGAGAVPTMVKALDSLLPRRRELAARVLGLIGPPAKDALGPLEKLRNDKDPRTRKTAVEAIRVIQGEL
jgi:HEAT repeat protein